jgi:hypothetical protein
VKTADLFFKINGNETSAQSEQISRDLEQAGRF